jgi:hypothetical protein
MKYKFVLGLVLLTILLGSFTISSSARPNYMAGFLEQYDVRDTRLATCDMCHINPNGGGARDSYGLAYAENGKDFLAIEELDSDDDGFTNIEEINALTFPGDSDDYPEIIEVTETEGIEAEAANSSADEESETDTTANTETAIETSSESDVENSATEVQSPGFGIILAVFAMIAAFWIKR